MATARKSDLLWKPLYAYSDVDYIAGARKGTAKRWLNRSRGRGDGIDTPGTPNAASFLDLLEVVAVVQLRDSGWSSATIETLLPRWREITGVAWPVAHVGFKALVSEKMQAHPISVAHNVRDRVDDWATVLGAFTDQLDYDEEWAYCWWPMGRHAPVIVNPELGFGLPVVAGTGVRTEILLERIRAGEAQPEIANDFSITSDDVSQALRFELTRSA